MNNGISYLDDDITRYVVGGEEVKVKVLKIIYASSIPYYLCVWLVKFTIIGFFYRIIPKNTRHRMLLHSTTVILIVTLLLVLLLNIFLCNPIRKNWSLSKVDVCYSSTSVLPFVISSVCNFITDIMVFVLPFPLVPKLTTIPAKQRYGLIAVFSLGAITILVFLVRTVTIAVSTAIAIAAIFTAIECGTAIVVACLPSFRVFLKTKVKSKIKRIKGNDSGFGNDDDDDIERGNYDPRLTGNDAKFDTSISLNTYPHQNDETHMDGNIEKRNNMDEDDDVMLLNNGSYTGPVMEFPGRHSSVKKMNEKEFSGTDLRNLHNKAHTQYLSHQSIVSGSSDPMEDDFDDEIDEIEEDSESESESEEIDFSTNSNLTALQKQALSSYTPYANDRSISDIQLQSRPPSSAMQHPNQQQATNGDDDRYTGILVVRTSFDSQRSSDNNAKYKQNNNNVI